MPCSRMQQRPKRSSVSFGSLSLRKFSGRKRSCDSLIQAYSTESSSGSSSPSGSSLFSLDSPSSASLISALRISLVSLVVPTETKVWEYCRYASTGNTFQEVRDPRKKITPLSGGHMFDVSSIQGVNPMAIPLKAQFSNLVGYILCV